MTAAERLDQVRDLLVLGGIKLAAADGQMRFAIDEAIRENVPVDDLESIRKEISTLTEWVMERREPILQKLAQIEARSRG